MGFGFEKKKYRIRKKCEDCGKMKKNLIYCDFEGAEICKKCFKKHHLEHISVASWSDNE